LTADLSILIFEFEEVFGVSILFILLLMYLFYMKYPLDKEVKKDEKNK
jgi:hypothetical protein